MEISFKLTRALWRVYNRPERPRAWAVGGNLPWDEPAFSARMLREHMDESHGAASRVAAERALQIEWLWERMGLEAGQALLDVTCGPGLYAVPLARRGLRVTGIDFGPAAIAYARTLAAEEGVAERCTFIEEDVRQMAPEQAAFDAAILLYGQLAVFSKDEARTILARIAAALKPGGRLALEILDPARIDKRDSNWWFTDNKGLWGDAPFLHLGERFWDEAESASVERYHIIHLESGEMDEIALRDQAYEAAGMVALLGAVGFEAVEVFPEWRGLGLYDAAEWVVYVARAARI